MISVVLVVINTVVIEQIFRRVVHMDHYDTQTKYIINLSQKLTIAQFINSAIVTCVIDILYNDNVFGPGGLIYTMFYFFVINAVSGPVINYIDISYVIKLIKQKIYFKQKDKCMLTQVEANQILEYPRHEIEISYADIMKTMYISIFYSTVVPIGQYISIVGIIFYYWVEKYIIVKRKTIN